MRNVSPTNTKINSNAVAQWLRLQHLLAGWGLGFALLLLFPFNSALAANAQPGTLLELVTQLKTELTSVETQKFTHEQTIDHRADSPWLVTLTINSISQKSGDAESTTYAFNLADLNPSTIEIDTDKDEQLVVLPCRGRRDLIRVTEHDGDVDYVSELQIWSPKIDKATVLQNLFQEGAQLALEAWKSSFQPPTTLVDAQAWLSRELKSVTLGDNTTTVTWSPEAGRGDAVSVALTDKHDEESLAFRFSLAELDPQAVAFNVKRGRVSVTLDTKGRAKTIRAEENGEVDDYANGFSLPVAGVEEGRQAVEVLQKAIPLAIELRTARMPNPTDLTTALQQLSGLLTAVSRVEETIELELTPQPRPSFTTTVIDKKKGAPVTFRYHFDFGDLDPASTTLRVKGSALFITAGTLKGHDYVEVREEGEDVDYDDQLTFPVQDVETGRRLEVLLPYIIGEARKLPTELADYAWLERTTAEGAADDQKQILSPGEDDCNWRFQTLEESKKNADDLLYQFNLYDLDPKLIEFAVDSKGPHITLATLEKAAIINLYENGEPGFTDEMEWRMPSLSAAKRAAVTMQSLVRGCRQE